jgi:acyl-coenzyme A synthetase/AMP-(fatty) acid ligase
VVGLPHDIDGEHPLAFVVLRPEHQVKAEELIQFTNGNLVSFNCFCDSYVSGDHITKYFFQI